MIVVVWFLTIFILTGFGHYGVIGASLSVGEDMIGNIVIIGDNVGGVDVALTDLLVGIARKIFRLLNPDNPEPVVVDDFAAHADDRTDIPDHVSGQPKK